MAGIARQVTVEELEQRFRAAKDVVERSHFQAIWLLAKGHSTAEVAEIVALTPRWVNKLARRYEADGVDALGDRRRRNAGARPLLSEDDLEALRERLKTPPDDGGIWSGPKVARWIAARRGLVRYLSLVMQDGLAASRPDVVRAVESLGAAAPAGR